MRNRDSITTSLHPAPPHPRILKCCFLVVVFRRYGEGIRSSFRKIRKSRSSEFWGDGGGRLNVAVTTTTTTKMTTKGSGHTISWADRPRELTGTLLPVRCFTCLSSVWQVSVNCLGIVWELSVNFLSIVCQLSVNYLLIAVIPPKRGKLIYLQLVLICLQSVEVLSRHTCPL